MNECPECGHVHANPTGLARHFVNHCHAGGEEWHCLCGRICRSLQGITECLRQHIKECGGLTPAYIAGKLGQLERPGVSWQELLKSLRYNEVATFRIPQPGVIK